MALFRPAYTDKKTGEQKTSAGLVVRVHLRRQAGSQVRQDHAQDSRG